MVRSLSLLLPLSACMSPFGGIDRDDDDKDDEDECAGDTADPCPDFSDTSDTSDTSDSADTSDEDSGGGPATYTAVTINFDDLDREIDVSTTYAQWVTFEAAGGYALYSWDYASFARSEPMSAYTTSSPGGAGAASDLTFTFAAPVRNLSFYTLGDQTNGPLAVVDIRTESGETGTARVVGDGGSGSAEHTDLSEWTDITEITVRDIEDSYSVNFDDISFEIRD